jgi:hypothetical protein
VSCKYHAHLRFWVRPNHVAGQPIHPLPPSCEKEAA